MKLLAIFVAAILAIGPANVSFSDDRDISLTPPDASPPSSPSIAFISKRDGNAEIYAMNADGTAQTRLTSNGAEDLRPDFSKDGSRIVFASNRDGNFEIYVMNADGAGQTRVTSDTAADDNPAFSPDGSRIAFQSTRDGDNEIYLMNADGSGLTQLTSNTSEDAMPHFSFDGAKIVFQSKRDGGNEEIYVMNADGTGQTRLTSNVAQDMDPVFSPDGGKIAFHSARDGNAEIYVMNADGTGQTRLTENAVGDYEPAFRGDGGEIAFSTNRDGNFEIYTMNLDGTGGARLTNAPGSDGEPTWGHFSREPAGSVPPSPPASSPAPSPTPVPTPVPPAAPTPLPPPPIMARVATPTINPSPGTFTDLARVSIQCPTAGAIIRYTTNGSDPASDSPIYTGTITLNSTTILKARGFHQEMLDSDVAGGTYTILARVAAPSMSPSPGTYGSKLTVTPVCATGGAIIRYTTDGADPTGSSPMYLFAIPITQTTVVKARAFRGGMADSEVTSGNYVIRLGSLIGITLRDAVDASRNSGSHLEVMGRSVVLEASTDGSPPSLSWIVDGRAAGSGPRVTVSLYPGTHTVSCSDGVARRSGTIVCYLSGETRLMIGRNGSVERLADVLRTLNRSLGQGENLGIEWSIQGNYVLARVNQTRSPRTDFSHNINLDGSIAVSYHARIPGLSISLPYCRAGAYVEPAVRLDSGLNIARNGEANPPSWRFGGGVGLSGRVSGGLEAFAGTRNIFWIEADIRGTVKADGRGDLQGPPAHLRLSYNIGRLTASGQLRVYALGQPLLNYSRQQTVWNGLSGNADYDLSGLIRSP